LQGDDGLPPPREMEMMTTDMETRLRSNIVRLFQPAIGQITDLGVQLAALEEKTNRHGDMLAIAETLREEVLIQKDRSALLAERLDKVERQAFKLELTTSDGIQGLTCSVSEHQKMLTRMEATFERVQRETARIWEEAKRLQDQHDTAMQKVWNGIGDANKKSERAREDSSRDIRELRSAHDDLLEDLYGEGKGLNKLSHDFAQMSKFVSPIPGIERALKEFNERTASLESHRDAVLESCHRNDKAFSDLQADVERRLRVMRDEFHEEANRMIAHNATLMRLLRKELEDECAASRRCRDDLPQMQMDLERQYKRLEEDLQSEIRRVDALHREFANDIDELHKRRKKDKGLWEAGILESQKSQKQALDFSHQASVQVQYIGKIISLVLEGERLANALHVQDFADRKAELWVNRPSDGRPPAAPETAEALLAKRRKGAPGGEQRGDEILTVDWRQGMALRKYRPGQITYRGLNYDRMDLLLLHHSLLQQAHTALESGPPRSAKSLDPGSPRASAGDPVHMQKDATGEQHHTASKPLSAGLKPGGRQRPGSVGQPQAVGSRGTATGSPGSPPDEAFPSGAKIAPGAPVLAAAETMPLKLPSISGGSGGGSVLSGTGRARRSLTAR